MLSRPGHKCSLYIVRNNSLVAPATLIGTQWHSYGFVLLLLFFLNLPSSGVGNKGRAHGRWIHSRSFSVVFTTKYEIFWVISLSPGIGFALHFTKLPPKTKSPKFVQMGRKRPLYITHDTRRIHCWLCKSGEIYKETWSLFTKDSCLNPASCYHKCVLRDSWDHCV